MLLKRLFVSRQLNLLLFFSLICFAKTVCLADWAGSSKRVEMLNYFPGLWMISAIKVQGQALGGSLVLGRLLYIGLLLCFCPRPSAGVTFPLSLLASPTSVHIHLLGIACFS